MTALFDTKELVIFLPDESFRQLDEFAVMNYASATEVIIYLLDRLNDIDSEKFSIFKYHTLKNELASINAKKKVLEAEINIIYNNINQ